MKSLLKYFWLMIKTMNEENKNHKNYLNDAQFNVLGPLCAKVLNLVREIRTTTMKSLTGGKRNFDIDEEDLDKVKDELAKICRASTYVMEISG